MTTKHIVNVGWHAKKKQNKTHHIHSETRNQMMKNFMTIKLCGAWNNRIERVFTFQWFLSSCDVSSLKGMNHGHLDCISKFVFVMTEMCNAMQSIYDVLIPLIHRLFSSSAFRRFSSSKKLLPCCTIEYAYCLSNGTSNQIVWGARAVAFSAAFMFVKQVYDQ